MNTFKKLVKDGFAHILVGNTLVKAISFVSSICVVRILTKVEYGELGYVDNLMNYVLLFSGLGMSTSLLKYVSPSKSREENYYYANFAYRFGLVAQILLTTIVISLVLLKGLTFKNALLLLLLEALYPAVFYLLSTTQSLVRAYRNNVLYSKMAVIQSSIVFVLSVAFAFILGKYGVVIARYIGMLVALVPGVIFLKKIFKESYYDKPDNVDIKAFLRLSVAMMITNLFSSIIMTNEMLIINYVIKDELVTASYKAATLIPSQITIIANSVIVYIFPIVGDYESNKKRAYSLILKAELLCASIVLVITAIGIVANPILIRVLYGTQYLDSISISNIYWIVCALNAGIRMIPLNLLPAIGKAKFCAIMSIASSVIHVIIDYYMISHYGIVGAVYAAGAVYLLSSVVYWVVVKRTCND